MQQIYANAVKYNTPGNGNYGAPCERITPHAFGYSSDSAAHAPFLCLGKHAARACAPVVHPHLPFSPKPFPVKAA